MGWWPGQLEIVGDRERAGACHVHELPFGDPPSARDRAEAEIAVLLAGPLAEMIASGDADWDDACGDVNRAVRAALELTGDCERAMHVVTRIRAEVEAGLRRRWPAVEALAGGLLEEGRLAACRVREILLAAGVGGAGGAVLCR